MNKLKQAINNSPIKRKEICETVGISTTTLWNFENNKHTKTIDAIKGLCKLFNKPFEELFRDNTLSTKKRCNYCECDLAENEGVLVCEKCVEE